MKDKDREYVLLGLTEDYCRPVPEADYKTIHIRGWACLPGCQRDVLDLEPHKSVQAWTNWARRSCRPLRAGVLEWALMGPTRGYKFLDKIAEELEFRRIFMGFYTQWRLSGPGQAP